MAIENKDLPIQWHIKDLGLDSQVRVLVVDDDITCQTLWSAILDRITPGNTCDCVTSGTEADRLLQLAEKNGYKYDLIVSDIFLSGSMTGIDLWEKYKTKFASNFILMSGVESKKITEYFDKLEGPEFLEKPFNMQVASKIAKKLLNSKL